MKWRDNFSVPAQTRAAKLRGFLPDSDEKEDGRAWVY
jgi:hypothetical protein